MYSSTSIISSCILVPLLLSLVTSMRQHIVRPATRLVNYNPLGSNHHVENDNLYENSLGEKQDFRVRTRGVTEMLLSHLVRDENEVDSMWHLTADAARPSDSVDIAFHKIKQRDANSKGRLIAKTENDQPSQTQHILFQGGKLNYHSIVSYFRQLLSVNGSVANPSDDNLTSSFVHLNDESVVHRTETLQSNQKSIPGYNVSSETEYNVSGIFSSDQSGINNATSNDTSTVIYTKAEPCNLGDGVNGSGTIINPNCIESNSSVLNNQSSNIANLTSEFQPIRMRAILSDVQGGGQHLNEDQRVSLLDNMLRPALLAWSAALRVNPVKGNLTVDASQLYDGDMCGPDGDEFPKVAVPIQHTTIGVADTDIIVYIGLSFTQNDTSNGTYVSDTDDSREANFSSDKTTLFDNLHVGNDTSTQEVTYVKQKRICAGDYVAASAVCSTDQFDRPTAAFLHICIDETFFDPLNLSGNIRVMMHELGHALGFNSVSLAHFRRLDGTPITKRNPDGSIPLTEIECTGPVTQLRQRSQVALPSEEILQFRTVRNGIRAAEIVTPNVRQVVRNHFNCQDATGAELESGEFLPFNSPNEMSCLGDHWERRLFQSDLMNPIVEMDGIEANPFFSTLTLSFFADSGWYQVDLSRGDYPSSWGRAAGCDFVALPCVSEDGKVSPSSQQFFCTQKPSNMSNVDQLFSSEIQGCTSDLSRKATCSLGKYASDLPREYQYFKNEYGAEFGGNDPFMDYCPVYAGFSNGLCSDSNSEALVRVSSVERFGLRNSRCLSSQVNTKQESSVSNNASQVGATALCLPIACVVEDHSLRIQVNGQWQVCSGKDEILSATIGNEVVDITCPDKIRVCPTFYCQRDCLGRSDGRTICDYNIGECVTWCEIANVTSHNSSACNKFPGGAGDNAETNYSRDEDQVFLNTNQLKNQLPDPQSPLADYYVPTARNLKEEHNGFFEEHRIWFLLGSLALVPVVISVGTLALRRRTQVEQENTDALAEATFPNPDKDKMMASIVVNLRMNDPALQLREQLGAVLNRESETDLSMTDTEASYVDTSSCAASTLGSKEEIVEFGDSDTLNHLGSSIDVYGVEQPSETASRPLVRRRHVQMHF